MIEYLVIGDKMDLITIEKNKFFIEKYGYVNIVFSTGESRLDFNKNNEVGMSNILKLREWFNISDIGYLNQIHGDNIHVYDGEISDGDGLITTKRKVGIGIFTADCVPILLFDPEKDVICSVHSGWKGTFNKIAAKAVEKMVLEFGSSPLDIQVRIGPHIRDCCYQVSTELMDHFLEDDLYDSSIRVKDRLSLENCIIAQLKFQKIKKENIKSLNMCTYCEDEIKLYSYRKSTLRYGRMFSFIYLT